MFNNNYLSKKKPLDVCLPLIWIQIHLYIQQSAQQHPNASCSFWELLKN